MTATDFKTIKPKGQIISHSGNHLWCVLNITGHDQATEKCLSHKDIQGHLLTVTTFFPTCIFQELVVTSTSKKEQTSWHSECKKHWRMTLD